MRRAQVQDSAAALAPRLEVSGPDLADWLLRDEASLALLPYGAAAGLLPGSRGAGGSGSTAASGADGGTAAGGGTTGGGGGGALAAVLAALAGSDEECAKDASDEVRGSGGGGCGKDRKGTLEKRCV